MKVRELSIKRTRAEIIQIQVTSHSLYCTYDRRRKEFFRWHEVGWFRSEIFVVLFCFNPVLKNAARRRSCSVQTRAPPERRFCERRRKSSRVLEHVVAGHRNSRSHRITLAPNCRDILTNKIRTNDSNAINVSNDTN